jgi:glycosyltransferase involved in cell wall biosynthesis
MKILHILSGDLWAGAEVMARNLLQGLQNCSGMELQAVLLNGGRPAREIQCLGIPTIILDEQKKSFWSLLSGLRRVINIYEPDVLHSHRYKENLLAYLATRGTKKTGLIRTQHGMPEGLGKPFSLKAAILRQINLSALTRCFGFTVAVSEEMKSSLVSDFQLSPKKVEVIRNGIKLPELWGGKKGCFTIGTCGRLKPVKNYDLFINIAAKIHQESPEIRFILAGDGPDREHLQSRVNEYGLEHHFIFLGHVTEMEAFYSGLDLYVSTSLHEGIPMSVLEAMGHGLPVIAPDVGGFQEIITSGRDGFLVHCHDPEKFAKKCLTLVYQPEVRIKMGQYARQKVIDQFSFEHMAEQYAQLYTRLTITS